MMDVFPILLWLAISFVAISAVLTALHYPRHEDEPLADSTRSPRAFYEEAYANPAPATPTATDDDEYGHSAREHANRAGIPDLVRNFIATYHLESTRALEVGCGSGLLQHAAANYVGMDLSFTAARFFSRPFVQASASEMPFRDDSFGAGWSIWVLEHIPNPEQALKEIRRVVKSGAYILLHPAWNVDPWASHGYEVRPFADFGLWGKLIKASIPIRSARWYAVFYARQVRILRTLFTILSGKPSRLRYSRLNPNYTKFWVTDSDAAVSLDFFEVYLWFHSRGDECLNCPSLRHMLIGRPGARPETLIIRVRK